MMKRWTAAQETQALPSKGTDLKGPPFSWYNQGREKRRPAMKKEIKEVMRFEEALNGYIHQIGITAKDLADASGLSTAVISRYRSGERTPAPDGEPLLNLQGVGSPCAA